VPVNAPDVPLGAPGRVGAVGVMNVSVC